LNLKECNIDQQIENCKKSIICLPCDKVEENFLIPKILIAHDDIHKNIFQEISAKIKKLSEEIIQLNEENLKIQQSSIENTTRVKEIKNEFKNLKTESDNLLNLTKNKIHLECKLKSLREEEIQTNAKFESEIKSLTDKIDIEIINNRSSLKYNIIDEEKFILPREHLLNSLKK
jgi:hypothetical protein